MCHYMVLWNIVGFATGFVPTTTVREDEQDFDDGFNDFYTGVMKNTCANSAGLPVGVQVVAHCWEDEKALAVMQSLEEKF